MRTVEQSWTWSPPFLILFSHGLPRLSSSCSWHEPDAPTKPSCQIRVNLCQTLLKPSTLLLRIASAGRAVIHFKRVTVNRRGLTPPVSVSRISSALGEVRSAVSLETVWSTCYCGSDGSRSAGRSSTEIYLDYFSRAISRASGAGRNRSIAHNSAPSCEAKKAILRPSG